MSDIQNNTTEELKILYSLAEIKENGYSITVPIPQEQRCKYCNKLFEIMGIMNPLSKNIFHFVVDKKCSCEGTLEEQNRLEYERNKKLQEEYEEIRKSELNKNIKRYFGYEFITEQFKKQTLDNFIINSENAKTKLLAQKFLKQFNEMKKGIIFSGPNGTGKTHIAISIANELLKQSVPVIFGTLTELLDKYKENYKNDTDTELTKLYATVDLLIIDDLGIELMNEWMLSKLFVIVNERMKNELPIIITTNYDMDQLNQRLSTQSKICVTPNSIISRLCDMCYRVECKGQDYRINQK